MEALNDGIRRFAKICMSASISLQAVLPNESAASILEGLNAYRDPRVPLRVTCELASVAHSDSQRVIQQHLSIYEHQDGLCLKPYAQGHYPCGECAHVFGASGNEELDRE